MSDNATGMICGRCNQSFGEVDVTRSFEATTALWEEHLRTDCPAPREPEPTLYVSPPPEHFARLDAEAES